jgi:hypothetical protein
MNALLMRRKLRAQIQGIFESLRSYVEAER